MEYLILFSFIFVLELCLLEWYLEFFKPKKSFLYKYGKFLDKILKNDGFVEKFLGIK